jgi:hypothetical protein
MDWTEAEEKQIAQIMATETMHDPENTTGEIRIQCSRSEALRRLQRRKVGGVYRAPSKPWVLADTRLLVTPRAEMTPDRAAALAAGRSLRQAAQPF